MSRVIENIDIYFGVKDNNDFKISKVNLDESAQNSIKETVDLAMNIIDEKEIVNIDMVDKGDDELLLKVNLSEVPWCVRNMEIIFQNKYEVYDLKNLIDNNENIKFYIVACEINNKIYYFYKKSTSNKLLAPKKRFLVFEENYLESLEYKNVLMFDDYYDFFIKDEEVYLFKEGQFSLLTGYYKKEKEKCNNILLEIEQLNIINEMDKLKEFCSDRISYVKKLSKIDSSSIKGIDFNKIKELRDRDNIDILIDETRNKIAFTNNTQLKNTIDILLDNFLVSSVTGISYRGINKKKV
jgi:hypothetical protein